MTTWTQEKTDLITRVRDALGEVKQVASSPIVPDEAREGFVDAVLDGASLFGILVQARESEWDVPENMIIDAQKWCDWVDDTMKILKDAFIEDPKTADSQAA